MTPPPTRFVRWTAARGITTFGYEMVLSQLKSRGHTLLPSDDGASRILASIYWGEGLYRWIKETTPDQRSRAIVGGLFATSSPAAVAPFCSGVYCGDGEIWDGASGDCLASPGHVAKIAYNRVVPVYTESLPLRSKLTGQSARIVELTRGCRQRCAFCLYSWAKPFRVGDTLAIRRAASCGDGRIRLVSGNSADHPDLERINADLSVYDRLNLSQDISLKQIQRQLRDPEWAAPKLLRCGIDGQSERLRTAVMKPMRTDDFVDTIVQCSRRGSRRIVMYNIWGYPTEGPEDCSEYRDALRRIGAEAQAPLTMATCWNAFIPIPQTPLQWAPSSWGNDHRDRDSLLADASTRPRDGINLFHMPYATGDDLITRRMLACRASQDCGPLVEAVALGDIQAARVPDAYHAITGQHLHGATDGTPPWDGMVAYPRDMLWRVACNVHRLLGISEPRRPEPMDAEREVAEWRGDQRGLPIQPTFWDDLEARHPTRTKFDQQ